MNLAFNPAIPVGAATRFSDVGWGLVTGAGYNFTRHHAVIGEFMWDKLYSTHQALEPLRAGLQTRALDGSSNVFAITGNYRFEMRGGVFGVYVIVGGGWYDRYNRLSRRVTTVAGIPCAPAWNFWGFACTAGTVTENQSLTSSSSNVIGANGGVGFTVRVGDAPNRFYVEPRFHYAPTRTTATQFLTISVGFRY